LIDWLHPNPLTGYSQRLVAGEHQQQALGAGVLTPGVLERTQFASHHVRIAGIGAHLDERLPRGRKTGMEIYLEPLCGSDVSDLCLAPFEFV